MRKVLLRLFLIIISLILVFVIGGLIYFKYFMFVPDKGGMEATDFCILTVTPYNDGTDEFGNSVGYGKGKTKEYKISIGDLFYEDYGDTLVQNPLKTERDNMIDLLLEIKHLEKNTATILLNQEERKIEYGEDVYAYSLIQVLDGASTRYHIQIVKPQ